MSPSRPMEGTAAAPQDRGAGRERIFPGDGEMARRMRSFDWSRNPLGPPESWQRNLKTSVRIMLTSRHPMFVWWSEQLINLYNDGYAAFLCAKHPDALGRPAPAVWPEIWEEVGPRAEFAMHRSEGTYDEALPFILLRKGFPEETYVTFSYSPIPDDHGGFGGILCPVTEETERIIGERQMRLLRELGARTADARTPSEACTLAASALQANRADLPFALIYLVDPEKRSASLAGASGISRGSAAAREAFALGATSPWPIDEVCRTRRACLVPSLAGMADELPSARGHPVTQAVAMPMASTGGTGVSGAVVVGLNPLRQFDDRYRQFLDLVAGGISAAVTNAQAYEAERRRAEALAELDRAKTTFFSNVSHEFRTPLTLMLAPLEDELRENPNASPRLEIVHRNSLRLLKLVNTLLDFSRIEAGRVEAVYEPTDLAAYTVELASVFRSAIEKAGMRLVTDCPPLGEPAYVDREMWEKIVLNLLSNAFKFTFEGQITVTLRERGRRAELSVGDTGVGIPEGELPRLFERFHRVRGSRSRTYEGTGIGLALVRELVRFHGGEIGVQSATGRGATFTVSIPLGSGHLPADRIGAARAQSTASGAMSYVEEASGWVPDGAGGDAATAAGGPEAPRPSIAAGARAAEPAARILLADDNADMRDYLRRLLAERHEVIAVGDGEAALAAALERAPDLILSDVMMPGLDGYALVRRLRAEPRTRLVPIILVSARAGEEARVEGLEHGADDYLIKPFGARELLARVDAHLALARTRKAVEEALRRGHEELERRVRERTAELEALQQVSTKLIQADRVEDLYEQILDTAMAVLHADFASIYRLHPDRGTGGELRRLGHRGFTANAARFWERVRPASRSTCGSVLATARRCTIPDVEKSEELAGTPELAAFRETGIRAVQTTPLFSRSGVMLGVFSTHWREPHELTPTEVRALEVLARQAADLIERTQAEATLRTSEARQVFLLKLADALRPLASPGAIQAEAARVLCEHLHANRVQYGEVDRDDAHVVIAHEHVDGLETSGGPFRMAAFGPAMMDAMRAGSTLVIPDVERDSTLSDGERAAHRASGIAAEVAVPLVKEGRLAAVLFVHQARPRAWSPEEVAVIEEVAERTWSATARGRAEKALQESEARVQTLAEVDRVQRVLVAEIQHRSRNLLALVRSIMMRTLHSSASIEEAELRIDDRLSALSRVHGLLSRSDVPSVSVRELVEMELRAAAPGAAEQVTVRGPAVDLPTAAVRTFSLALHELATNAVKYGALAGNRRGRLAVTWGVRDTRWLVLRWNETGSAPRRKRDGERRGFGRELIEQALPYELDARTRLDIGEHGVSCTIELPLAPEGP